MSITEIQLSRPPCTRSGPNTTDRSHRLSTDRRLWTLFTTASQIPSGMACTISRPENEIHSSVWTATSDQWPEDHPGKGAEPFRVRWSKRISEHAILSDGTWALGKGHDALASEHVGLDYDPSENVNSLFQHHLILELWEWAESVPGRYGVLRLPKHSS